MITTNKKALVLGAGGFIGAHLAKFLRESDCFVVGVDIKEQEFNYNHCNVFQLGDLRDPQFTNQILSEPFDFVFQLAADMGGSTFVFTGLNDADIMHNSAMINLNVADAVAKHNKGARVLYTSSACIYPEPPETNPKLAENMAYPADCDSDYGWEKLFSERMWQAYARNKGLDVRIARLHNVFGPYGTWQGGREKAPAALCRKIAAAEQEDYIEVFGTGEQTRTFLYIDECVEGLIRLLQSNVKEPINIGSEELVTINQLVEKIATIAGKDIKPMKIPGPLGARNRCSDNRMIRQSLGWCPSKPLDYGLAITYKWIEEQIQGQKQQP